MRSRRLLFALFLSAATGWLCAVPIAAQVRPGLDLRAGVAVPWKMDDGGLFPPDVLERGTSFSLHLGFPMGPKRGFYLGFAQHSLECGPACSDPNECGLSCAAPGNVVSTSWVVGVRVEPLIAAVSPWLKLGLLFDRTEADFRRGAAFERRTSSIALGPEVGAGLSIRLAERVSLSPGARFVRVAASFPNGGDVLLKVISADVGLSLAF